MTAWIRGLLQKSVELELLLAGDEWRRVGPGYTDVNAFLRSIDLSPFNLGENRPRLHRRIKELQPKASTRAIGQATGTPETTTRRDLTAPNGAPEPTSGASDQGKHNEPAPNGAPELGGRQAAKLARRQGTQPKASTRAIGQATGTSKSTVDRDLVPDGTPEPTSGASDQHGQDEPVRNRTPEPTSGASDQHEQDEPVRNRTPEPKSHAADQHEQDGTVRNRTPSSDKNVGRSRTRENRGWPVAAISPSGGGGTPA